MTKRYLTIVAFLLSIEPSMASAQWVDRQNGDFQLGVSVGTFAEEDFPVPLTDTDALAFRMDVDTWFRVGHQLAVVFQWGAISSSQTVDVPLIDDQEYTPFELANPMLGLQYIYDHNATMFRAGVAGTFSAADVDSRNDDADVRVSSLFALRQAVAMGGGLDPWLWWPNRASLVVPLNFSGEVSDFRFGLGLTGGFMFDTAESDRGENETEVAIQVEGEGALVLRGGELGLRMSVVSIVTEEAEEGVDESDPTQFAVEPFARLGLGDSAYVETALLLNIDDPYGFSFNDGRFWAVSLRGGAVFW